MESNGNTGRNAWGATWNILQEFYCIDDYIGIFDQIKKNINLADLLPNNFTLIPITEGIKSIFDKTTNNKTTGRLRRSSDLQERDPAQSHWCDKLGLCAGFVDPFPSVEVLEGVYGVYIRISHYREWIEAQMRASESQATFCSSGPDADE